MVDRFMDRPGWARASIATAVAIVVLAVLLAVGDTVVSAGRIHPGVHVGAVSVGGMRVDDARSKVEDELAPRLEETVTVTYEAESWAVSSADVGARVDATACADAAFDVGRSGGLWERITDRIGAWFSPVRFTPCVSGRADKVAELLDSLGSAVEVQPTDASVSIEGTSVALVPSAFGIAIRRTDAEQVILAAFVADERAVELPVTFNPASVSDADAAQAYEDVLRMISDEVAFVFEDREWAVGPSGIGGWIAFRKVPYSEVGSSVASASEPGTGAGQEQTVSAEATTPPTASARMILEAYVEADEVSATVVPLTGEVGRPAKDAEFQVGGGSVTIIPSEVGLGVDVAGLAQTLDRVLRLEGDERVAEMRLKTTHPARDTEDAEQMGIVERIATFTTTFSSSNRPRVNNIQTLTSALDGTLIPPGGVFSFNQAVGERTAEKGYQEAGTIVNGRLVPTLGGGICQVCTTLFNSVFFSGLPVVERWNHSFYIASYPKGRDATVSWGGPDFAFKNDTGEWILIATASSSSAVTISLYGTDPGYEVEYVTGAFRDVKAHPTKEVEDPELDEGTKIVEESGVDGRSVTVTRRVLLDGDLVREDHFTSRYNPKEEMIRVGTKPLVEEEPDGGSETTTETAGG